MDRMRFGYQEALARLIWYLSGVCVVLQASVLNGLLLDPFSLFQDFVSSAEIDIRRCEIAEALMVSAVVVMVDECADLSFQVFRRM